MFQVYDVFAVATKERAVFQQPQKCGGEKQYKVRSPTAVSRSPEPTEGIPFKIDDGLTAWIRAL